jgi:hypothetical protein
MDAQNLGIVKGWPVAKPRRFYPNPWSESFIPCYVSMGKPIHRTVTDVKNLYCFGLFQHSINDPINVRLFPVQEVAQLLIFGG